MQIRTDSQESQGINVSNATRQRMSEKAGRKSHAENKKMISAKELGLNQEPVMLRKMRAQRRALKVVTDAWNSDRRIDQDITDIREKIKCLQEDIEGNQAFVEQCQQQKSELMETYGIEEGDLELLSKQQKLDRLGADSLSEEEREEVLAEHGLSMLTEEEKSRLSELASKPLDEFMQRYKAVSEQEAEFSKRIDDAQRQIDGGNASITAIRQERLKFHGMVDARNKADEIMKQASDEIVSLLWDEAKEHIDEDYEEQREEAKEKAEEKEEQEEIIEKRREEKEELEAQIEVIREEKKETEENYKEQSRNAREDKELLENAAGTGVEAGGTTSGIKGEIKQILHKMKLLEEDLKGSAVDEEL